MKLNIFLFILLLYSCGNNNQIEDKNSVITKGVIESKKDQTFEEYWNEFGVAIQNGDTNKIKLLVDIPLRVVGREDRDPELKLNDTEIIKYLLYIINKGGYYDFEKDTSISNRTLLISDINTLSQYDKYSKNQWIKDFVFKKTPKGWKLIIVYTDTKDLKNKLK